jgi:hypothetical protein
MARRELLRGIFCSRSLSAPYHASRRPGGEITVDYELLLSVGGVDRLGTRVSIAD